MAGGGTEFKCFKLLIAEFFVYTETIVHIAAMKKLRSSQGVECFLFTVLPGQVWSLLLQFHWWENSSV